MKKVNRRATRTCAVLYPGLVDVHETVGAGIVVTPDTLPLQLFPGRLRHGDVVELEPLAAGLVEDECPVMTTGCLTFMD